MNVKYRMGRYIRFFIYLVVVILVNLAAVTLFFRLDLTGDKLYSISEESKTVISTLSEPLTIKIFFTRDLPAPYNNTERYLHDLLEEYSIYANKYFNYHFYNVSAEEGDISKKGIENRKLAKNYGINPVQIQMIEKDEVKFREAYMGLVIIHGDIIEKFPTIKSIDGLEYRLTTAIQKLNNKISVLLSLPEKIHVKLFLSSSLEVVAPFMNLTNLHELPGMFKKIVKRLNVKNYGKLEFEYLDPTKDEALETEVKKYNLMRLKWPALSKGKIKPGKGTIGLVIEYEGKAVEVPLLQVLNIPIIGTRYELVDMGKMEETINDDLESIININEDIGYLSDHGTLKLPGLSPQARVMRENGDGLSNFQSIISQTYSIKDINIKEDSIPKSLNCMIIARPTEAFTDYELYKIDQFLMTGKSLCLFIDAFNEVIPPSQAQRNPYNQGPRYVPISTGLEKLLEFYGIRIRKSYVMDEHCYKQKVPDQFGGGERSLYFAPLIKSKFINTDPKFMQNIKGLIALKNSPLELEAKLIAKNSLKAIKLVSSSEKSWEMKGQINLNPMFIQPPKSDEEKHSLPLAYLISGEFPSYFADKPIPDKKVSADDSGKKEIKKRKNNKTGIDLSEIENKGEFISKGRQGKIFIMASSNMLKDNLIDGKGRDPNATFIMNVIDHLNNRDETAVMRSKVQRFNPLYNIETGTRASIKAFNIAGLPVLVVIFGFLVWFRRNSRKKVIKKMFQK